MLVMDGDPTDNNATLFAQGYNGVLKPAVRHRHVREGRRAGRHLDPPIALTEFQQQYTAHPNINAVVIAERRQRRAGHPLPADA